MECSVADEGEQVGFEERSEESGSCARHAFLFFFLVLKGNIFFRGTAIYIYDWLVIRLTKSLAQAQASN
jgi:hypothetical protein